MVGKLTDLQDGTLTYINVRGTNAIGKSTRMNTLVEYLGVYEEFLYTVDKKGKIQEKSVGHLYRDKGILIVGAKTKSGTWVGVDNADFSSGEKRQNFVKDIKDNYKYIKAIIFEGYFNNCGIATSPETIRALGVDYTKNYFFIYDNINQFLERTNGRTGKSTRGLDWAENSQGWRDNKSFNKCFDNYSGEQTEADEIFKLNLNTPKDFFVTEFFGENFEIPETTKTTETTNEESLSDW